MSKPKRWVGRIYIGDGNYSWVGRFHTRRERDRAVSEARAKLERERNVSQLTVCEYYERYIARYEREWKSSSLQAAKERLKPFVAEHGERRLDSFSRHEAELWAQARPNHVPQVVAMFNAAMNSELLDRNPFRGLVRSTKGRADQPPPTEEELGRLLAACSVFKGYARQMRALIVFAVYSGVRPGELWELKWEDIDLTRMRIRVSRRLYRGEVDVPKSGKPKIIALTPPARDALLSLLYREGYVFRTKTGKRMSAPAFSWYWQQVKAASGLDFDFYLATKHYCVHYLWTQLQLSPRAIAAQMGWSYGTVEKMLAVYGHAEVGALEEVDVAFRRNVVSLRSVLDADKMQGTDESA